MKYAKLNLTADLLTSAVMNNAEVILEASREHTVNRDEYLELLDSEIQKHMGNVDINVVISSTTEFNKLLPKDINMPSGNHAALFVVIDEQPWVMIEWDFVADLSSDEFAFVLKHELVHYDQWKRGDLEFGSRGLIWKGDFYPMETITASVADDEIMTMLNQVSELPWETEAYARVTPAAAWLAKRQDPKYRKLIDRFLERAVNEGYYDQEWYHENVVNVRDGE
jgi:hypothetical protein